MSCSVIIIQQISRVASKAKIKNPKRVEGHASKR